MLSRRPKARAALAAALILAVPALAGPSLAAAHKNWAQRHPTLTAIGAGLVVHHALKTAAARDKAQGHRLTWAERHPTLTAIGAGVVTHHVIKSTTH